MKKIKYLLLLAFIFVIGCGKKVIVKYKDMYDLIKDTSFEKFIYDYNYGTELIYQFTDAVNENGRNYLYANFIQHSDYYLIDFANEDLFLFN